MTLQDYTDFLIMKETDVVNNREEVLDAFATLDTEAHNYLTISELTQVQRLFQ